MAAMIAKYEKTAQAKRRAHRVLVRLRFDPVRLRRLVLAARSASSASASRLRDVRGRVRKMKGALLRRHDGLDAGDVRSREARSEHRARR